MGKTVLTSTRLQRKEARLVAGMHANDRKTQQELYAYCMDYFQANHRGVFFADEETASEIFQRTFITLWENIERGKISAYCGIVMGKDGEPLKCSILTYFMGIARIKYKEWVKSNPYYADPEAGWRRSNAAEGFNEREYIDALYGTEGNTVHDIIADVIAHMSERCSEILRKFYYEEKDLDTILNEIPTLTSKDALKTKKYKCMETLRTAAQNIYNTYINS